MHRSRTNLVFSGIAASEQCHRILKELEHRWTHYGLLCSDMPFLASQRSQTEVRTDYPPTRKAGVTSTFIIPGFILAIALISAIK
jgi:hypothetical protein